MIEIEAGRQLLLNAVHAAKSAMDRAQDLAEEDVAFCRAYLDGAAIAIAGLEREYDSILSQAKSTNRADDVERRDLYRRIEDYLTVDALRLQLLRAIEGLKKAREALARNANSFWRWEGTQRKRQAATARFGALLGDLETYLVELEQQGLRHRDAGTGVAVEPLRRIQAHLQHGNLTGN